MTDSNRRSARRVLRMLVGALLLGGFGALVAWVLTRQPLPAKAAPIQARLELAAGEVLVDERVAVSGTALVADTRLRTKKGARALVRLPDGSSLFLRDATEVRLSADRVRLETGEYWLDAPPTDRQAMVHQVGDATLTAAESGLSVARAGASAKIYVARGTAIVTSPGGRVEVNAGEQARIDGRAAPNVTAVAFWEDWTGGMADLDAAGTLPGAGAGTIYGVDFGGTPGVAPRRLEVSRQAVHAVVRDGLSETQVDQTFFNPGERSVEGWYWFTVPERASVTGFAVETDGVLVEGEFTERREASAQYAAAAGSGHAPALLEWIDGRTYRARIYPVAAGRTRRVVLRYVELSPVTDGRLEYVYPMGAGQPVRIGEFSLEVDLGEEGKRMKLATLADARIEQSGSLVTMRRSGYTPRAPFQLEASVQRKRPPLTVARFSPGGDSADYVLARYSPDVDWSTLGEQRADVVVVVDTSAAGDEASRQLQTATAEAILRGLSDSDRFALVALDVRASVLHPQQGLAPASDGEIARALEALADHAAGGATDLAALFDVSLARLHGTEQPAIVYVGDGIATSGELRSEALVERLRRALGTSRARLFTVGVGADADHALLGELARAGGGQSFRVDEADETTARALQLASAIKVPTITDLEIDLGAGLDEPFATANGKLSRGGEVALLARTHHDLPPTVKVRGRVGGKSFEREYESVRDKSVLAAFVPRLWAAEYLRRLLGTASEPDAERGRIVQLGIEYGIVTPFTSILALESEEAYSRMGIQRRKSPLRGERLSLLSTDGERRLAARLAAIPAPALSFGCSADEPATERAAVTENGKQEPAPTNPYGAIGLVSTATAADRGAVPPPPQAAPMPEPVAQAGATSKATNKRYAGMEAPRHAASPRPVAGAKSSARAADALRPPVPGPSRASSRSLADAAAGQAKGEQGAGSETPVRAETWVAPTASCSDAAARPLAQRILLWRARLRAATSADDLIARYEAARSACELGDWRAERTFLELTESRIDSEGSATRVLGHFGGRPEVQKFVARLLLRRAVDPRLAAAVEKLLFGGAVDWNHADLELQAIADVDARIAKLREIMAAAPEDPNGGMRLVGLLVEAGRKDEAVSLGRRLRADGELTPALARKLGDVLAAAGLETDAVRTYSEIVEFDPASLPSRRLLGDIYLGHGWYDPAYRQYRTLTELHPDDALGWLRLASAAAGSGRVDEALRVERRVASAQGQPGPNDPRRWARLFSAARLARLLAQPAKSGEHVTATLERELKELQLFSGPGTLVVLTWEDLDGEVTLVSRAAGRDVALGEATDAAPAGLAALQLSRAEYESAKFAARLRSVPRSTATELVRHDVTWDGKRFHVAVRESALPARGVEVEL